MSRLLVSLAEPTRNFMGRTPTRGVAHAYNPSRRSVIHTFVGPLVVTGQVCPPGGPSSLGDHDARSYVICLSCRVLSKPP